MVSQPPDYFIYFFLHGSRRKPGELKITAFYCEGTHKKNDRIQFQCVIYQSQWEMCQRSQWCHAARTAHTQPVNYRPEEQRCYRFVACATRSTEVCYINRAFPSVTGLLCLVQAVAYSQHQNISRAMLLLIPHPGKVLLTLLNTS